MFWLGGKAKPLKQPKVDKKEYDEVQLIVFLIFFMFRICPWIVSFLVIENQTSDWLFSYRLFIENRNEWKKKKLWVLYVLSVFVTIEWKALFHLNLNCFVMPRWVISSLFFWIIGWFIYLFWKGIGLETTMII